MLPLIFVFTAFLALYVFWEIITKTQKLSFIEFCLSVQPYTKSFTNMISLYNNT